MNKALITAMVITLGFTDNVWAHGDEKLKANAEKKSISREEKSFGREGDPAKATHTVNVDMSDQMRFTPAELAIRQGETIRFNIKNSGKVMHEFVLGSMKELKEHAAVMKKHPGMEHDEPYMAHVAPGKTQSIIWQFTRHDEFNFGCLIPGHFEAGMIGKVTAK